MGYNTPNPYEAPETAPCDFCKQTCDAGILALCGTCKLTCCPECYDHDEQLPLPGMTDAV